MREFFRSRKFKVLAGIAALLFGMILYAASTSGAASLPSAILGAVLSPVQRLSSGISDSVRASLDKLLNAVKYYRENEALREKLTYYYNLTIDNEKLKEENEALRQVIGLKEENPDYVFSPPAAIIARGMGDVFGGFSIDKGSYDDISLHDPVITADGLVGYVTEVAPTYSRVTTILSPDLTVAVYCVRTQDQGTVSGSVTLAEDGTCLMRYIDQNSDIQEGDLIVTAGQTGVFPEGRVVGTVESVGRADSGLSLSAVVRPAVELDKIGSVFVITSFQGQGLGYEDSDAGTGTETEAGNAQE